MQAPARTLEDEERRTAMHAVLVDHHVVSVEIARERV